MIKSFSNSSARTFLAILIETPRHLVFVDFVDRFSSVFRPPPPPSLSSNSCRPISSMKNGEEERNNTMGENRIAPFEHYRSNRGGNAPDLLNYDRGRCVPPQRSWPRVLQPLVLAYQIRLTVTRLAFVNPRFNYLERDTSRAAAIATDDTCHPNFSSLIARMNLQILTNRSRTWNVFDNCDNEFTNLRAQMEDKIVIRQVRITRSLSYSSPLHDDS